MYKDPNLDLDVLLAAINRLETAFSVYDTDFRLMYANESAKSAWPVFYDGLARGLSYSEAMRAEIRKQFPDAPDEQIEAFTEFSLNIVRPGGKGELETRDGRIFETNHELLGDAGAVGIGVDLTELKFHQRQLKALVKENYALANEDELTGLSNRRHFLSEIEKLIAEKPDQPAPFTLALLDLDGFKLINDVYGHPVGDELLRCVAERLQSCTNETHLLARLGGDEFGLVSTRETIPSEMLDLAQQVAETLSKPYDLSCGRISVSASIGVAGYPDNASDREMLFKRADYALYYAKQTGKGAPVIFSDEHEELIGKQANLNLRFREANWEEELYLDYQPIYASSSKTVQVVEALARWNNPHLGLVSPLLFIPIAEKSGAMTTISKILFEKALRDTRSWPQDVCLSFNLSPLEVTSIEHADALIELLHRYRMAPERVIFEITESAMINDEAKVARVFKRFRECGIRIALDDFGSGFSSLNVLSRMPLDIVKIDRSVLDGLGTKKESQAIVNATCGLCRELGLTTVVEGVESDLQLHSIRKTDVELLQGFLFSRPRSRTEILADLNEEESRLFLAERKAKNLA